MIDRGRDRAVGSNGLSGDAMAPMFPTPTAGDGIMRPNNARPGKHQPDARPSQKRKVACSKCGFPADLSRYANDGGSLDAQGAGGNITKVDGGDGLNAGEQKYRAGAGCPCCFSKDIAPGYRGSTL